ncbi:MAG: succinate dehydrogenase [Acidimicrobiia bacterium]|nr:succinate dehydrogenase [Acidimicrobiia bacterium]
MSDQRRERDFDIVIIGCGVAGAAAAASAAERALELGVPLRIHVIERAEAAVRGGNSRWTAAYLRMTDIDTPAPGFVNDLIAHGGGAVDRAYAERLAEQAGPTLRWLADKGVEFDALPTIFLTSAKPRLLPVGGGRVVLDTLLAEAEANGVTISYQSAAWRLTPGDDGTIESLHVRGADGYSARADVGAVIIASGGFEGNAEMMTRYVGSAPRTVAIGGQFNQGEGIAMALELGAKGQGEWGLFHAEPVDPRSSREEAVVMIYPYAILVDREGRRFVDEGYATIDEQYEAVARRILELPGRQAWIIADQSVFELPRFDDVVQTTEAPVSASTIAELAAAIGVPADALCRTVEQYNAAIEPGPFDPLVPDGKRAVGIDPPKSNWALPIAQGPFVAWPLVCSNVFTFGGLATDLDGRVVSGDGAPIPGLYAAGEVTGLYHGKYTGATSVLRGLVYGRLAGRHAADFAAQRRNEDGST